MEFLGSYDQTGPRGLAQGGRTIIRTIVYHVSGPSSKASFGVLQIGGTEPAGEAVMDCR